MGYEFTAREGAAFLRLLTGSARDIVLRIDAGGRIVRASDGLAALGVQLADMLFPPTLADLAEPRFAGRIRAYLAERPSARVAPPDLDLPLRTADGRRCWYRLRALPVGRARGFVALLRSIDDLRELEDAAFVAGMTDPLTGLANRHAFQAMLAHLIDSGQSGVLALFDLERFRALNLAHGPRACDELLRSCAALMRQGMARDHILARIGADMFAALMPEHDLARAQIPTQQVCEWFNQLARQGGGPALARMHAACVPFAGDFDATLRAGEAALIRARAGGVLAARTINRAA